MTTSVNEQVLDDLIEHEVSVRRVIGGAQRQAANIHIQLEKELAALYIQMDPTTDAQVARYLKKAKQLIAESFRSQSTTLNATLRGVARAENDAVNGAIETVLNDE